jgi:hypothetical protein
MPERFSAKTEFGSALQSLERRPANLKTMGLK